MEVVIRTKSIDMGGQTYPFQGIARVGTWEHSKSWKRYAYGTIVALFFGISLFDSVPVLGLLALLGAAYFGWKAYEAKNFHYYSLRLETGGAPRDAVFSKNRQSIHDLRNQLVSAIDSPPLEAVVINDPTFVNGDQINVDGSQNIGKAAG